MKNTSAILVALTLTLVLATFALNRLAPGSSSSGPVTDAVLPSGTTGGDSDFDEDITDEGAITEEDPAFSGPPLSDYVRGLIEAAGGSPVPVLVPYAWTLDEETATAHGFRLRITRKGYTALMTDGALDYVITGTNVTYRGGEALESEGEGEEPDAPGLDYIQPYEDFDTDEGGTISFGYAGFDYQVDFHCRRDIEPERVNCVEADIAQSFVEALIYG